MRTDTLELEMNGPNNTPRDDAEIFEALIKSRLRELFFYREKPSEGEVLAEVDGAWATLQKYRSWSAVPCTYQTKKKERRQ